VRSPTTEQAAATLAAPLEPLEPPRRTQAGEAQAQAQREAAAAAAAAAGVALEREAATDVFFATTKAGVALEREAATDVFFATTKAGVALEREAATDVFFATTKGRRRTAVAAAAAARQQARFELFRIVSNCFELFAARKQARVVWIRRSENPKPNFQNSVLSEEPFLFCLIISKRDKNRRTVVYNQKYLPAGISR
jgi:hypothetical protein